MDDIKVGTKVYVFSADMKTNLGEGVYVGDVDTPLGKSPAIELSDGDTIYGYECWWTPEQEDPK